MGMRIKQKSILDRLGVLTLGITAGIFLAFGVAVFWGTSAIVDRETEASMEYISNILDNVYARLATDINSTVQVAARSRETVRYLSLSNAGEEIGTAVDSVRFFDTLNSSHANYYSIMLYNNKGEKIIHSGRNASATHFVSELEPAAAAVLSSSQADPVWRPAAVPAANSDAINIYANLFDAASLKRIGVMQVCVLTSSLASRHDVAIDKRYQSFLLTSEDEIIWGTADHPSDAFAGELVAAGGQKQSYYSKDGAYYVRRSQSASGAGALYTTILVSDMKAKHRDLLMTMVLLMTAIGVIMVLLFLVGSRRMFRPLVELSHMVDQISPVDNQYEIGQMQAIAARDDEIGRVGRSFSRLMDRVRRNAASMEAANREQRRLELELLMSQIKPHFLYNTIETICGMARLGRNGDVYETAKMLGTFYRCNLSDGMLIVPVESELMHAVSYLEIVRVRSGGAIAYWVDAPPGVRSRQVLRMILQPVVENAFVHGLRTVESGGRITITAAIGANDCLVFTVEDNGVGMSEETLQRLRSKQTFEKKFRSFGIRNVDSRIRLYYGGQYGVSIDSTPGRGTRVTIELPPGAPDRETPPLAAGEEDGHFVL